MSCQVPSCTPCKLKCYPRAGIITIRGFAKGVAGTVSLPIFSVFFRFLPFSSIFSVFSLFSFRFLPFFSVFFRLFRFFPFFPFFSVSFRFFPFLSVFFRFCCFFGFGFFPFFSVFFRFLPFFSVSFRFFPFSSVFFPFSSVFFRFIFRKKRGDTVCETPFAKPRTMQNRGTPWSTAWCPSFFWNQFGCWWPGSYAGKVKFSYRCRAGGHFFAFFPAPLVHMIFLEKSAKLFVPVIFPHIVFECAVVWVREFLFPLCLSYFLCRSVATGSPFFWRLKLGNHWPIWFIPSCWKPLFPLTSAARMRFGCGSDLAQTCFWMWCRRSFRSWGESGKEKPIPSDTKLLLT